MFEQRNTINTPQVSEDEDVLHPLVASSTEEVSHLVMMADSSVAQGGNIEGYGDDVPILHEYHALQDEQGVFKGEIQPPAYRDVKFAVLFWIHIFWVVGMALKFGRISWIRDFLVEEENQETDSDHDHPDPDPSIVFRTFICIFVVATSFSMLAFHLMLKYPSFFVKAGFVCFPVLFSVLLLASSSWWGVAIFALFSVVWYTTYARCIPFATSTLQTACEALKEHLLHLYLFQCCLSIVLVVYTTLWFLAFGGLWYHDHSKGQVPCSTLYDDDGLYNNEEEMCDVHPMDPLTFLAFLVSFFWTQQVVRNIVHTTTSRVVATWWWSSPRRGDSVSPTLNAESPVGDSLRHSISYSFGSICFGSLLVAILQTIEFILESLERAERRERDRDEDCLVHLVVECLVECLLPLVRRWLEYFNSWAYCYVGIFGYDYVSEGRNVVRLFQDRGWTTFAGDRLLFRVIVLVNVAFMFVAIFCSAFWVMASFTDLDDESDGDDVLGIVCLITVAVGFSIGDSILSLVESAARTVIVLFADSPSSLSEFHADDYEILKEGWSKSYPEEWERSVFPLVQAIQVATEEYIQNT